MCEKEKEGSFGNTVLRSRMTTADWRGDGKYASLSKFNHGEYMFAKSHKCYHMSAHFSTLLAALNILDSFEKLLALGFR